MADHLAFLKSKGLTFDKVEEYKAAFTLFDPTGTGAVTVESLGEVLNGKFGQSYAPEDLQYMLRQFLPADGSATTVDFPTFALSLHAKTQDPRYNEAFGAAFTLFARIDWNAIRMNIA